MDGRIQPGNSRRRHPMAVLQDYLTLRSIEPHISCSSISPADWDCRLACGPYMVHGTGRTKERSVFHAARKILTIIENVRTFPWLEQGIRWNEGIEEDCNRFFLRQILTRIENRVRKSRHWWTSACATLLTDELVYMLQPQGASIRESIYPGRQETLIVWEITTNPKITLAVTGQTCNRIRFDLLLESIQSLRIRLEMIEQKGMNENALSIP